MVAPEAVILVAFGLPSAVWPHAVARLEERLDSIGSTRSWNEVEPAAWKVTLPRVVGVAATLLGLAVFVLA